MIFSYDESGAPIAIHYRLNGSAEDVFYTYYLEKNLQGDIIALYNSSGTKLVGYTYDAWGNCTTTYYNNGGSTGAQFNPFRYRGYYYDTGLELYYLNSRYYDSRTGRFINADDYAVIGATPNALTDKNLYSYCDNNPVMREDGDGEFWESAFDVISLGASILEVCVNPTDIWAWAGLVGDTIDLIPFMTGAGEVIRVTNASRKIAGAIDDAHDTAKALDNTIDTYKALRKVNAGNGLEVHHIVEKRFARIIDVEENDMLSIALSHEEHLVFTNAWRTKLPYGKSYDLDRIWEAAQDIYKNYPNLLEAARKTLGRY